MVSGSGTDKHLLIWAPVKAHEMYEMRLHCICNQDSIDGGEWGKRRAWKDFPWRLLARQNKSACNVSEKWSVCPVDGLVCGAAIAHVSLSCMARFLIKYARTHFVQAYMVAEKKRGPIAGAPLSQPPDPDRYSRSASRIPAL